MLIIKKYFVPLIIVLIVFPLGLNAQTQTEHFEHMAYECSEGNYYSSSEKAIAAFVLENLGFQLCTSACPYPIQSRQPHLLNPNVVVMKVDGSYCLEGKTRFKWNKPPVISPGPVGIKPISFAGGDAGDLPGGGVVIGGGLISQSNDFAPAVLKVFPNPGSGQGKISIRLPMQSNLEITIQNITGSIIQKIDYPEMTPAVHQIPFDLSAQGSGVYYMNVIANDQLIKTIRLIVI